MNDATITSQGALAATLFFPLAGALLVGLLRGRPAAAAPVGTATGLLGFVASLSLLAVAPPWAQGQDTASIDVGWIGLFGSRLHLGWDGITAPLVILTSLLGMLVCAYVWFTDDTGAADPSGADPTPAGRGHAPPPGLLVCLLLTQAGAVGTFLARDLFVFFVGFEAVLIPMWVIVSRWGSDLRTRDRVTSAHGAATRFVLYTMLGSAVMLLGLILLAARAGTTDLVELAAVGPSLDRTTQVIAAVLLTVGLGVKVPVWPVHSWLPGAHTTAPTVGSVLLAGVLLKLGSYGLVRLVAGLVPDGLAAIAVPLGILGAVGVIWGALVCLVESDLKRLVAFSSVAHMGFVVVGVASGTPEGIQGALFVGIAHGVITSLMFWVVGMLKHRLHTADLATLAPGLRDRAPRLGWLLALSFIAGVGLPGLAGFWGEVLAIMGAWRGTDFLGGTGVWIAAVCAIGTALAAAYLFRVLYLIWHGPAEDPGTAGDPATNTAPGTGAAADGDGGPTRVSLAKGATAVQAARADARQAAAVPDVSGVELAVTAPLVVATFALGVLPWLLLSVSGPAVRLIGGLG